MTPDQTLALLSLVPASIAAVALLHWRLVLAAVRSRPPFSHLSPEQIAILHRVLHVEMLESRRGRYGKADAIWLEKIYGEVNARKREMGR